MQRSVNWEKEKRPPIKELHFQFFNALCFPSFFSLMSFFAFIFLYQLSDYFLFLLNQCGYSEKHHQFLQKECIVRCLYFLGYGGSQLEIEQENLDSSWLPPYENWRGGKAEGGGQGLVNLLNKNSFLSRIFVSLYLLIQSGRHCTRKWSKNEGQSCDFKLKNRILCLCALIKRLKTAKNE